MQGYGASTYGDRFADVYDDWYPADAETTTTVDFLADLAGRTEGVVLELGIGTGRLALPLAARGFDVRGIDASAAMVARLRAKPGGGDIPVEVGDMAAVEVPRRGDEADAPVCSLVCCVNNTFFGITDVDDQRRCLRRIHDVLRPGGSLVLAAFVPPDDADDDDEGVTIRSMTVDTVVLSVARRDRSRQRIEGHFVELTERGNRLRPYVIRYAAPGELDTMAADAGLTLVERLEDVTGTTFDPATSVAHVSVYRRADA